MKPFAAFLFLSAAAAVDAADIDFYREVYPFLKANCIACHNKTTTKADLNMETPELMIKGGESGPSIIPGKGAESLVVLASVHADDMEMPPSNNKSGAVKLTPAEIAILKQWIDQGAKSGVQEQRTVAWQAMSASVDPIYSIAMSKDGRYAVCGRGSQLFFYDLATRQLVGRISDPAVPSGAAHRALVQSLSFSPDGTRLASGSFREVKIWRLEQGKAQTSPVAAPVPPDAALLKKLTDAAKVQVLASAMSPDKKQVVLGCADGSVRVYDAASLKLVSDLRGSVTASKKTAELEWSVATQALEQAFQKAEIARAQAQDKALEVLLTKANEAIVAMKKVLPEKQKLVKPTTDAKAAAQKTVDDVTKKLATVPKDKPDAALTTEFKTAQDKLITAKMSEVSALAAVSAAESNVKDAEDDVKRITESKAKNAKLITAANSAITAAKAIEDKAMADLAALKAGLSKPTSKPVVVAFSPDAQRVAAMSDDGALRVWAVATATPVEEVAGASAGTTSLTPNADGSFTLTKSLTLSTQASPRWVLERTLGGEKQPGVFIDRVNALRFSPDGKMLATGGGELSRSGDVILFDVASGKANQTWKEKHADCVLSLDFSPDGKRLATGAADKIARVTEIATGKQVNIFEGHTHHVMGLAFRSDGRVLATAGCRRRGQHLGHEHR